MRDAFGKNHNPSVAGIPWNKNTTHLADESVTIRPLLCDVIVLMLRKYLNINYVVLHDRFTPETRVNQLLAPLRVSDRTRVVAL